MLPSHNWLYNSGSGLRSRTDFYNRLTHRIQHSPSSRFQPLPIRTAREVFPQAAHPMVFAEKVMCPGGAAHAVIGTGRRYRVV